MEGLGGRGVGTMPYGGLLGSDRTRRQAVATRDTRPWSALEKPGRIRGKPKGLKETEGTQESIHRA